ncbi:MAG: FG-GAP repeat domain-containing protein [Chloroflexota bacterium]
MRRAIFFYSVFMAFFLLVLLDPLLSQTNNHYGFDYWKDVKVKRNGLELTNPWSGGLNNIQVGEIDLDMDGSNDLVLFDKHGNRILPFIFHEASRYSPIPWYELDLSYRKLFPPIKSIFQLRDYNNDGKPDIFTYTTGGLSVYKNISEQTISFKRTTFPYIRSLQGSVFTNLLVTNVDYPGIYDLDNDGDLDIITFWGLGSFMDLHQNMSVETFGNSDSLLYHKVDNCWGQFAESQEANDIYLDTCLSFRNDDRHTGSTISLIDANNDSVLDLLLGDVDFLNLKCLINGGSDMSARMVQVIDSFPGSVPVRMASFPVAENADIYNDGEPDLLISPFDPGLVKSAGYNSLWRYQITDTSMTLATKSFLQDEMIDLGIGAYPVFTDLNNDGLTDLVISNYGNLDSCYYDGEGRLQCVYHSSLYFYKNTGTTQNPEFTYESDDFKSLSSLKVRALHPAFADINNDEVPDMMIGIASGELWLYLSRGTIGDLPDYLNPVRVNPGPIGEFSTPAFIDIDGNGLTDLMVGNKAGSLSLYKNTGTLQNPVFTFTTSHFGQINVTDSSQSYTGYSVPAFFHDNMNNVRLLVGSESGNLFYYPEIRQDPEEKLISRADVFLTLKDGIRCSASLKDINGDNFIDMAVGNYAGGVVIFKGVLPGPSGFNHSGYDQTHNILVTPNPSSEKVKLVLPCSSVWLLKIADLYGQSIDEMEFDGDTLIYNSQKLKSGLYIVTAFQLYNKNRIYSGKMIILQ